MVVKYQLYHLFSLMTHLHQIFKKKLTDLINFLVVIVYLLTKVVNVPVRLFLLLTRDFRQLFLMIMISTNMNKSHGHNDISINLIKTCSSVLMKPLLIIFNHFVRTGTFHIYGKNLMLYLFTKNDKQLINNYRPISLLPIFSKIYERIIFDNIYRYLDEYNLLNPN